MTDGILIVDDESSIRLALGCLLDDLGVVFKAGSVQETSESLASAEEMDGVDLKLAVVDLRLGADHNAGFDLVDEFARLKPNVSVILLSVRNDEESIRLAQERVRTVAAYFVKPWSGPALLDVAKKCLAGQKPEFAIYKSGLTADE